MVKVSFECVQNLFCQEFVLILYMPFNNINIALDSVYFLVIFKNTQPKKYYMFAYLQQNLPGTALDLRGQKGIVLYLFAQFYENNMEHFLSIFSSLNNNSLALIR